MLFDLSMRDNYKHAGRKRFYITIQVFQSSAKSRKVGLRYTQNEMIMLDRMDSFCAKLLPTSRQQIILPDGKRLKISGHVCKSYHFTECVDLPTDLKEYVIPNNKDIFKLVNMVIC